MLPSKALRACDLFLRLAALWAFLAVPLFPARAQPQQPWLTLPPTPSLPEAAASGQFAHAGARHWYGVYGEAKKPAVVLLHGGGANSNYWGHLVRDLARDYRVIVMDSRGQGRSTNETPAISYEQMAQDAIALLDHLGVEKTAVVGWSDGANIGFYLALRRPDRITALVAFGGNATPAGYQQNTNPALMAVYVARTRTEHLTLSPEPARYAATMAALSVMWRTQPTLSRKDLAAIRVRTAVFHAEHDEVIRRAHAQEIAAQIPNAKFVLLRGVSHFAMLQDPKGFGKAVRDFLEMR